LPTKSAHYCRRPLALSRVVLRSRGCGLSNDGAGNGARATRFTSSIQLR
jgi:hypothetical protein